MNDYTPIDLPDLLDKADAGATIVTSGARLAAYLDDQYARRQMDTGKAVWESPHILTWNSWIHDSAQLLRLRGILDAFPCLSGLQERALWEASIREAQTDGLELVDVQGTAARAQEARRLSIVWRLTFGDKLPGLNVDSQAWLDWSRCFDRRLKKLGLGETARLPDELADRVASGAWKPASPIVLTGFDELTPQQNELVEALRNSGAEVQWCELRGNPGTVVRRACVDVREEARQAANWVRTHLERDPEASIGIVAPELEAVRSLLEAYLIDALQPGAMSASPDTDSPDAQHSFNISLGLPLGSQPIVQCALSLLQPAESPMELAVLSELLGSPFIKGFDSEYHARVRLARELRRNGEARVGVGRVIGSAEKHGCAIFASILKRMSDAARDGGPRSPSDWASRFPELLDTLGWARGRSLNSHEYQAAEAFRDLLSGLATLENLRGKMPRDEAVVTLRRMAGEAVFQPRSEASRVQVLGVLEAVGMQFDHLWLFGMHDGAWPPAARPNPFLPLMLQRELKLPRSSPQRELEMAEAYTRRLTESAANVVVSYPEMAGDEQLRCSPLVSRFPLDEGAGEADFCGSWLRKIVDAGSLESWLERQGPPVPPGHAKGGSALLKAQSACAFRSFVEHRLLAREIPKVGIGLNAMQRGILVHDALETLWSGVESSAELLGHGEEALQARVEAAVSSVIDELAGRLPDTLTSGYRAVEEKRLISLIREWLRVESERPPFRVLACEEPRSVNIAGLELSLKLDRLDELEDGRRFVIDYKTGKVSTGQWFGERPKDPQLPLYGIAAGDPVGGVAFGVLRADKVGFAGVAQDDGIAPDVETAEQIKAAPGDWVATRAQWTEVLERLAGEFLDGRADVDPSHYQDTCKSCPLNRFSICRVREKLATDVEEDDDD